MEAYAGILRWVGTVIDIGIANAVRRCLSLLHKQDAA
jgi:hypothetical protein